MGAEYSYSRRKLANGAIGAGAFVVMALVLGAFALAMGLAVWVVVPAVVIVAGVFGWVAFTFIRRFDQSGTVLRIDEFGVLDQRLGRETIPWSEVDRVETVSLWGQDMLELRVGAPQRFLAPPERVMRLLPPIYRAIGYSPLVVSPAVLAASYGDVLHAVRHFRPTGTEGGELSEIPGGTH